MIKLWRSKSRAIDLLFFLPPPSTFLPRLFTVELFNLLYYFRGHKCLASLMYKLDTKPNILREILSSAGLHTNHIDQVRITNLSTKQRFHMRKKNYFFVVYYGNLLKVPDCDRSIPQNLLLSIQSLYCIKQ